MNVLHGQLISTTATTAVSRLTRRETEEESHNEQRCSELKRHPLAHHGKPMFLYEACGPLLFENNS